MTDQDTAVTPYASGHGWARAASLLLGIFAFTSLPLVGLSISNMRIFSLLNTLVDKLEASQAAQSARDSAWLLAKAMEAIATLGDQLLRPVMIIGLIAGIVGLVWIHRVHSNLPALGARDLKFTPLWAVGWWFIPFFHFYRPYQIVHEIWQGSDPGEGSEETRQIASPTTLLGWWWALFVSGLILRFYYPFWAQYTGAGIPGAAADPEFFYVEASAAALNIGAAVLGIVVIVMIDRMQTEKHRRGTAGATAP